jgi:hypothetical protein
MRHSNVRAPRIIYNMLQKREVTKAKGDINEWRLKETWQNWYNRGEREAKSKYIIKYREKKWGIRKRKQKGNGGRNLKRFCLNLLNVFLGVGGCVRSKEERIWKETVGVWLRYYRGICLEVTTPHNLTKYNVTLTRLHTSSLRMVEDRNM